ncbi:MAG: MFS transporter [Pseudomonadota bacterium]
MTNDPYRWVVLAGCWSLYFVFGLSVAGLAPLVSTIQADLGLSASAMGTVLGAWQFVYIFAAIPVGLALQRFGAGRLLLAAGLLIAASGFWRASADSYGALLAAVALFGLGGPIVSAGVPHMVSMWFEGKERGLAMGLYITGPAIAGIIAYASSQGVLMPMFDGDWRSVLRVWAWAALAITAVWFLIYLRSVRAESGAGNSQSGGGFEYGLILRLLRSRNVALLLATGIGVLCIDHGLRNWIPEILRTAGWSAEQAGYLAVISVVFGVAGALAFPRLAVPKRRLSILRGLFACAAAGCLLLSTGAASAMIAGLVLTGLASGAMMTITILSLIEQRGIGAERAGLAGGMFFAFAEIGGVGGPVMIGVAKDATGVFPPALWLLAGLCVLLIGLTLMVRTQEQAASASA